ncbi:hypothetical protein [Aureimonas pseudogalii]|uniref:Uncharacterized protein n=1 Tax=Aureimonas pseudogalii TaxID=1744844 RepID=A0A7W6ED93_9HYPH|nr:hypothetical protein [Aureimonas pseudogalii]MBB3997152.1 hypothetical protein [Aureimonas pseudogalii]
MINDDDDASLAALRKRAERRAIEKGLEMLDDPKVKDTARASVVRAFLGDAIQRRGEDDANLEPHEMSAAQVEAGARRALVQLELIRREADDAEIVPAPRGVFD